MARWVPGCMAIWGLCTALHIWVRAKWQLILLRTIIGMLEGILCFIISSILNMLTQDGSRVLPGDSLVPLTLLHTV